ncbi:porimin [Nycticebus coucang]|uniref:porimin n=1 Tax=Nycticebus coucang TaxID=9470 RepID=UPI00234C489C|nr:porimin [Nycticebus coucang]
MGRGARGVWAALLLGTLQVLALLGAALDPVASRNEEAPRSLQNSSANSTDDIQHMHLNSTSETSNSTVNLTSPPSSVVSTGKPTVPSKTATSPVVSTNRTLTTLMSTTKTSVSQNTSQPLRSTVTTAHNGSVVSVSSSITVTSTIHFNENKGSKFDTGSFVGGIVLTLGVLSILYIGCKMYYSRRGIRYRTIDEHDAII